MRSAAASLITAIFCMTATISLAQTTKAHPKTAGTPASENCCACSDPPGGSSCCQNPDDFVGCVVKDGKCNCICFSPDSRDNSFASQSDRALELMLGAKPSNTTAEQRAELFKMIVASTERGQGRELQVNDEQIRLTLMPPKDWSHRAEIRKRPPIRERLFEREKFVPPQRLMILEMTDSPPEQ
jgi:hypothetical protein